MSTISLRLPDSLHETLRRLSKKEHMSINQFVTTAVAEKVSALMTEEYLEARAKPHLPPRLVKPFFFAALLGLLVDMRQGISQQNHQTPTILPITKPFGNNVPS